MLPGVPGNLVDSDAPGPGVTDDRVLDLLPGTFTLILGTVLSLINPILPLPPGVANPFTFGAEPVIAGARAAPPFTLSNPSHGTLTPQSQVYANVDSATPYGFFSGLPFPESFPVPAY
jgi:hypothetical protein